MDASFGDIGLSITTKPLGKTQVRLDLFEKKKRIVLFLRNCPFKQFLMDHFHE
jgi:hypothetical protein